MPPRPSDGPAIEDAIKILTALGCPDVRRAQGNPDFMSVLGPNKLTPDITTGPVAGFEDRHDFYIDLQQPSGEYFDREKVGVADAHEMWKAAQEGTKRLVLHDLDPERFKKVLIPPIEAKLAKYVGMRGSPLFGHVNYFGGPDALDLKSIATFFDYMLAVGGMVAVDHGVTDGQRVIDRTVPAETNVQVRTVKWKTSISFLATVMRAPTHAAVVILVNENLREPSEFSDHPVVRWLLDIAERGASVPSGGL
jgi:hypothetical protein